MSKKLVKLLLFIFVLVFIVFIHVKYSEGSMNVKTIASFLPHCSITGGYSNLSCTLERIVDDDRDGNVSLNITIFNSFDYPLTDVSLIFEYESYVKHEKIVESKGELNVETPDSYNYLDRVSASRFPTSFKFTYTDASGEKKEFEGQFHSPIFKTREAYEDILRQERGQERGRKISEWIKHGIQPVFIFLAGMILIWMVMRQLKRKRIFDSKNLIASIISGSFLASILTAVYASFIRLLFAPTIYHDVPDYGSFFTSVFLNKIVLVSVFLISFTCTAIWLYKNFFSNEVIVRKALLLLTIVSFVLAVSETLVNQLYWDRYNSKGYLALFAFILGITAFVAREFLLKYIFKKETK